MNRLYEGMELTENPVTQVYSDSRVTCWWFRPEQYFKFETKLLDYILKVFSKAKFVHYEIRKGQRWHEFFSFNN